MTLESVKQMEHQINKVDLVIIVLTFVRFFSPLLPVYVFFCRRFFRLFVLGTFIDPNVVISMQIVLKVFAEMNTA